MAYHGSTNSKLNMAIIADVRFYICHVTMRPKGHLSSCVESSDHKLPLCKVW